MVWSYARPVLAIIGAYLAFLPLTGCPCNCGDSEAILQGTWQLTGEALDPSITEFFIEFSSNGEIDSVTYKINNLVFDYRDIAIFGFADVNGTQVEVSADWAVGEFHFTGTLNSTNDAIDGSITYEFISGGVTIGSDLGNATLTKQ